MRKQFFFLMLIIISIFYLGACQTDERQAERMVIEHLKMSIDQPELLQIKNVSKPDSAFGLHFFTQKDKEMMINAMRQVSDTIMKRTHNMERFDPRDRYVMDLMDRQMRANNDLRTAIYTQPSKGDFSGWKILIAYRFLSHQGIRVNALRWYFVDKNYKTIIKTVEIPLP